MAREIVMTKTEFCDRSKCFSFCKFEKGLILNPLGIMLAFSLQKLSFNLNLTKRVNFLDVATSLTVLYNYFVCEWITSIQCNVDLSRNQL